MGKIDYKKLGFKCGVEIHQQLLTDKKLFCRCPARVYSKKYDTEVLRHMRPTLSEMGVYDGTALMEFKTKKEIIYRINRNSVCTYELDDTPPFLINEDAIDIAIEIALLLGSTVIDEMHIARKQYLDGSIPTGFQRTAIVSMGGEIPFRKKKIHIRQFSIEEDSCREVKDVGHQITFLTDRLGMPLVEIVTEPDMETPEEAASVVRELGRLMRVTGKVRRGLGSVRQDVNVSIKGGTRVEIKGVPRYQNIPKLTHIEALRQKALLDIKDELIKRGLSKDNFQTSEKDLSRALKNTRSILLKEAYENKWVVKGLKLCNFRNILTTPTQPAKTFAHEISGRVRVIACLDNIPNLFHTDAWPEYLGWQKDWLRVKRELGVEDSDVAVMIWGPDADVETACNEIKGRIIEAFDGVPNETRQARFDGTNDFERILPGADRMYPDTDHPPKMIDKTRIKNIASNLPEKPWDIEKRYASYAFPKDSIDMIPVSRYKALIDRLEKDLKPEDLRIAAITITQTMKSLSRDGVLIDKISNDQLYDIFINYSKGKIGRKNLPEIISKNAV